MCFHAAASEQVEYSHEASLWSLGRIYLCPALGPRRLCRVHESDSEGSEHTRELILLTSSHWTPANYSRYAYPVNMKVVMHVPRAARSRTHGHGPSSWTYVCPLACMSAPSSSPAQPLRPYFTAASSPASSDITSLITSHITSLIISAHYQDAYRGHMQQRTCHGPSLRCPSGTVLHMESSPVPL